MVIISRDTTFLAGSPNLIEGAKVQSAQETKLEPLALIKIIRQQGISPRGRHLWTQQKRGELYQVLETATGSLCIVGAHIAYLYQCVYVQQETTYLSVFFNFQPVPHTGLT